MAAAACAHQLRQQISHATAAATGSVEVLGADNDVLRKRFNFRDARIIAVVLIILSAYLVYAVAKLDDSATKQPRRFYQNLLAFGMLRLDLQRLQQPFRKRSPR